MSSHYGGSHFAASHHLSSHFGREELAEGVERPWANPRIRDREDWYREQILQEDEEILEMLTMFLQVMDD